MEPGTIRDMQFSMGKNCRVHSIIYRQNFARKTKKKQLRVISWPEDL